MKAERKAGCGALTGGASWPPWQRIEQGDNMRRILGWVFGACALCAVASALAGEKMIIMVGGADKQIYLPATLAQRLGYFREQGLEVEMQSEASGVSATDVLLAGAAHGVIGADDHTIDLQAKGKSVQSVVHFTIAAGEVELVASRMAPRIARAAGVRGPN